MSDEREQWISGHDDGVEDGLIAAITELNRRSGLAYAARLDDLASHWRNAADAVIDLLHTRKELRASQTRENSDSVLDPTG